MDWTEEERRLLDRGGWGIWLGGVVVLVGLGLVAGFVGIVIGSDEALAARPFFIASFTLLGSAALLFVGGLARSIVKAIL